MIQKIAEANVAACSVFSTRFAGEKCQVKILCEKTKNGGNKKRWAMESNRRNSLVMMVAVLLLWPCVAQANAGTPLLWGEFLHLTGGNVLIGFMEGLLLYKLFKLERRGRCIEAMVLANFFFRLDWFLRVANIQRVCHSMDD